jgi:putative membrane protein
MTAVLGQMHMYGGNAWWMGLGMLLFWVVLIGVVAALVVALTRSGDRGAREDVGSRARDVLAERYAAGEIDTEEFQTRARELEKVGR